jgi:hypothetical protein
MPNQTYINNRWNLSGLRKRPQAVAWADTFSISDAGLLIPGGVEEGEDFLILSDHNRSEINFTKQRLENRQRMISGSMRSYHIADKTGVSWSWDMLPSRAYSGDPAYSNTGVATTNGLTPYTVDNGAGGVDIVKWYDNHPGSFYMFLAYDRFDNFTTSEYSRFGQYNEVIEVLFAGFDYSVVKRGGETHDFWNISVTLEEV